MQTYPEERKVLMLTLSSVELDAHNLILVVLEDVPPLMMGRPAVTASAIPWIPCSYRIYNYEQKAFVF